MTTVSSLTHVILPHDARHTAGADSGHVVVLSSDGTGSLISPDFKTVTALTVPEDIEAAALSRDASLLAVAAADGITLLSVPTLEKTHRLNDAFLSCLFAGEKLFWTCARFTDQTVTLEAWETGSWTKIARTKIADPYGGSLFSILPHPNGNSVVVWAAAGQDGQCLFWATLDGAEIHVTHFDALDETGLPSFSSSGDSFLVTSESQLHRYSYPQGTLLETLTELDENEDDPIGYFVSYVDDGHALLTSFEGRLFLVDVSEMSVIDEITVPNLAPGDSLNYLLPMADGKVVLVYRGSGRRANRNSHLHLLAPRQG